MFDRLSERADGVPKLADSYLIDNAVNSTRASKLVCRDVDTARMAATDRARA